MWRTAFQCSPRHASSRADGEPSFTGARALHKNYYRVLHVDTDATPQELKQAYRRLALQCHPDVVEDAQKAHAEVHFRCVSEAYEVLADPDKRRAHDTALGIQTRRKQWPSSSKDSATDSSGTSHANAASRARRTSSRGSGRASSAASARGKPSATFSSSTASQPPPPRQRYRKPFVRGDANRVFADAFDGKTLDEILFDVQRRRRKARAAASRPTSTHEQRDSQRSTDTVGSAVGPSADASSASTSTLDGGALDRDTRLLHVMEAAAESFAQKAQRQFGHGILRHIRAAASALPEGPAAPPGPLMPFRPFVGMRIPPGVQVPAEPRQGRILCSEEATIAQNTRSNEADPIPSHFHTHAYGDGTPFTRMESLSKATKHICGMSHNMGQLYSYHRPY